MTRRSCDNFKCEKKCEGDYYRLIKVKRPNYERSKSFAFCSIKCTNEFISSQMHCGNCMIAVQKPTKCNDCCRNEQICGDHWVPISVLVD